MIQILLLLLIFLAIPAIIGAIRDVRLGWIVFWSILFWPVAFFLACFSKPQGNKLSDLVCASRKFQHAQNHPIRAQ